MKRTTPNFIATLFNILLNCYYNVCNLDFLSMVLCNNLTFFYCWFFCYRVFCYCVSHTYSPYTQQHNIARKCMKNQKPSIQIFITAMILSTVVKGKRFTPPMVFENCDLKCSVWGAQNCGVALSLRPLSEIYTHAVLAISLIYYWRHRWHSENLLTISMNAMNNPIAFFSYLACSILIAGERRNFL